MRTWSVMCIFALALGGAACSDDDDNGGGNLDETFAAFGQALGSAATDACTCLADATSGACTAMAEQCFPDADTCMMNLTFPAEVQTCMQDALAADAGAAVAALNCATEAANTLKTCVGAANCGDGVFTCLQTYETATNTCMATLLPVTLAASVAVCMTPPAVEPAPDQGQPQPDAGVDAMADDATADDATADDAMADDATADDAAGDDAE